MEQNAVVFLVALGLAGCAAPLLLYYAPHLGLLDRPGGRKQHCSPTPQIGGLVIYAALWATLLSGSAPQRELIFMSLASITVFIGYLDDRSELSARLRLFAQISLGVLLSIWAGVSLESFGGILGTPAIELGLWAIPATAFAVATAKNAFNMVDGIDGLAGGLALIPVAFVAALAYVGQQAPLLHLCLALSGGLLVFLLMNYPLPGRQKAITFLGDTGSTLIGLAVAWIVLEGAQLGLYRPVFALYLLATPLLDTAGVMARRLMRGQPLFKPGRDHLHHILVDSGLPRRHATYLLSSVSLVIAGFGWWMEQLQWSEPLMFSLFLVMLVANLVLLRSETRAKTFLSARLLSDK